MAYLEPGVYSKTISRVPAGGNVGVSLTPVIIGSGAKKFVTTEVVRRSSDDYDVIPISAVEILSIGYTDKKSDFVAGVDYELDSDDPKKIKWLGDSGKSPSEDETYVVKFTYEVPEEIYKPHFITSLPELIGVYGEDIDVDGEINRLSLAAKIALETGAPEICVIQVKPGDEGAITGAQYQIALDEHAQFIEDAWRIVPVDEGDDINSVIDGHVKNCSSYEERKERCTVYTKAESSKIKTASDVISKVGGYASSKAETRTTVIYPASATKKLSNGETVVLDGPFIAAAYAGLEAGLPVYQSKTRASFGAFDELLGVQLNRKEKNKLAECGVLILEQPAGAGTNIVCRHQLTTDGESAETRENSVLACKDYTAKVLRGVVDSYIGKYNVTADTISKIRGSVDATFADLVASGILLEGSLTSIAQDVNNPDTIVLEVVIKVPYPCNYIKLTIISE